MIQSLSPLIPSGQLVQGFDWEVGHIFLCPPAFHFNTSAESGELVCFIQQMVALVVVGAERLSHEYLGASDAELLET